MGSQKLPQELLLVDDVHLESTGESSKLSRELTVGQGRSAFLATIAKVRALWLWGAQTLYPRDG